MAITQNRAELSERAEILADELSQRFNATDWLASTSQPYDMSSLGFRATMATRRAYARDVLKKRFFRQRADMSNATLAAYRRIAWYDTKQIALVEGPIEHLLQSSHAARLKEIIGDILGEENIYLVFHDISSFLRESCCALVSDPPTFYRSVFPIYEAGHAAGSWKGDWPDGELLVW